MLLCTCTGTLPFCDITMTVSEGRIKDYVSNLMRSVGSKNIVIYWISITQCLSVRRVYTWRRKYGRYVPTHPRTWMACWWTDRRKNMILCQNISWANKAMIRSWMMLGEVIRSVVFSFVPEDPEVTLSGFVSKPMVLHVP